MTEKPRTRVNKVIRFSVYFCAVFVIISTILIIFILNSRYFIERLEQAINSRTGMQVEIGDIAIERGPSIVIDNIIVKKNEVPEPFIKIQSVKTGFSLSSLLRRTIDSIEITKPSVYIEPDYFTSSSDKGKERAKLPVSIKKLLIRDGAAAYRDKDGKTFNASEINFIFKERRDRKTEVRGRLRLDELDIVVPVDATVDAGQFSLDQGHLDITISDLKTITAKGIPFLKDRDISGIMNIGIDITGTDGTKIILLNTFKDLAITTPGKPALLENASGDLRAELSVSADFSSVDIEAQGQISNPSWKAHEGVKAFMKGTYNVERSELMVEKAIFKTFFAGSAEIKGWLRRKPFEARADVVSDAIDIEKTAKTFAGIFPLQGAVVSGTGSLRSTVLIASAGGDSHVVSGTIKSMITNGSYSSADGLTAAEGINMDISGGFDFPLSFTKADFTLDARAGDFEMLAGSFYGDFTKKDLSCSIKGNYTKQNDTLTIISSKAAISDIGTIGISGRVAGLRDMPLFALDVRLKDLDNRSAYAFFIKETFKQRSPFLSKIDAGGTTAIAFSLHGTSSTFDLQGDLDVRNMDITEKDSGLSVQGVDIALPVGLSWPSVSDPKDTARFGSLSVQNISWKGQQTGRIEAFPAVRQNTLTFKEDMAIQVFGGDIRLKNVSYKDLLSSNRKLDMSVEINELDLQQITSSFKIPLFSGRIAGVIPKAGLSGSSLRTEGEIVIKVFGGDMRVSGLTVNNVFGPVPAIRTSVSINEIDMGRLTETLEFGHISGVLQGYVKDLVIAQGQAQAFEAKIETVDRKGVSQKISVDAINKISILGTGSASAILKTGIYKLFDEYRYAKIGFSGVLKNDNFLLSGIAGEEGRQYLVRGGILPPKVNVISYTQNVSFQEMLKRLNRIKERDKKEKIGVE